MSLSKRMIKYRLKGLSKSFGSQIDLGKSEELKRTKTDIENNLTRIVKFIKNEEQSKKDGNLKKKKELVGIIEDFYNQYQSLYALCGRVSGEYVKVAPCIVDRVPSESEYFSLEEVDSNTDTNDSNQKPFYKEREHSTIANNTDEVVLKIQASHEFEEQLNTQAREVKQLCAKNVELHAQVLELELLLKESKETVTVLQAKLKNNEEQATSKVVELMAQTNQLEQEAKSLRMHKGKNETLSQKKDFTDQINVMQQKLDSVSDRNKELEAQLQRERKEASQCLVQIENLRENLAETTSIKKGLIKENECFLARIKDLELEVESRCNKQSNLEDKNHELERAIAQRGEKISELLKEHKSFKEETSIEAKVLTAEVEKLRLELNTLQYQKSMLELQNERIQKECSESLAKVENLNVELKTRVADQEETIKKLSETMEQIGGENKQAETWSKNVKLCQQLSERIMEDNIRLLHQRIHVVEQLNNENKETHKMSKQRYEEDNKGFGEKIAIYENELRAMGTSSPIEVNLGLVSKMLGEVQFVKDWIREKNGEKKQLEDKMDLLTVLLGEKEEQELLLREKVLKLEANVSKEGREKLKLMKVVSQLERKVGRLEKNLTEKDEELVGLGEKKKEAIRQLCFLVDFHRNRCVYLEKFMSKKRVNGRK